MGSTDNQSHPGHAIGHSVNTPWPNLKKLIMPASTTAITTIFFPALRNTNGLGTRGMGADAGNAQGNRRWMREDDEVVVDVGTGVCVAGVFCRKSVCRLRGTGGGSSGRTSNNEASSAIVGMGVVRALKGVSLTQTTENQSMYFTTTIE